MKTWPSEVFARKRKLLERVSSETSLVLSREPRQPKGRVDSVRRPPRPGVAVAVAESGSKKCVVCGKRQPKLVCDKCKAEGKKVVGAVTTIAKFLAKF